MMIQCLFELDAHRLYSLQPHQTLVDQHACHLFGTVELLLQSSGNVCFAIYDIAAHPPWCDLMPLQCISNWHVHICCAYLLKFTLVECSYYHATESSATRRMLAASIFLEIMPQQQYACVQSMYWHVLSMILHCTSLSVHSAWLTPSSTCMKRHIYCTCDQHMCTL